MSTEVSTERQSSIDQVSIEGINQHLTADAFTTHDPTRLVKIEHDQSIIDCEQSPSCHRSGVCTCFIAHDGTHCSYIP